MLPGNRLYDLKVYLHTDGETKLRRRGIMDVAERGTGIRYLMKSHEQRRIQYELSIVYIQKNDKKLRLHLSGFQWTDGAAVLCFSDRNRCCILLYLLLVMLVV